MYGKPSFQFSLHDIGYTKLKKFDEALSALNKCIQLNPKYTKAFIKRGEVNEQLENHEEALRDL